jgi:hypothetical protein
LREGKKHPRTEQGDERSNKSKNSSKADHDCRELLKGLKERNEDLGRPFDDCFEMGDADEVIRILIERATDDLASPSAATGRPLRVN